MPPAFARVTMKIYTKQGDAGTSVLFDGTRVPKHHLRLQTYGTLDELNSHLGLAVATCAHPPFRQQLTDLQGLVMTLASDLATPVGSKNESKVKRIAAADITLLEKMIDAATAELPHLKRFILPGGGITASHLHVARTVCRRAERHLSLLMQDPSDPVGSAPLVFTNRLSDLLFTLARLANKLDGISDVEWNVQP
ncbi:MAG TPA: cob(I)yrinic acid a,c-diamide adenosyltransferase [Phycisphaerae bacterium]|nr:cob(I)yrinic acid a,c-diamide adenosyltransferase [Phycisphaerae bacterium]